MTSQTGLEPVYQQLVFYLESDGVFMHAGQQRLEPLDLVLFSLLSDALQNTLMTETHTQHNINKMTFSKSFELHLKMSISAVAVFNLI